MSSGTKSDMVRVVLSTFGSIDEARTVAKTLVEERLAACVSLVPGISSTYRWEGEVVTENEVLALIKTTLGKFPEVSKRIRELHSYDTPEIVCLEPSAVWERYGSWVVDEVS